MKKLVVILCVLSLVGMIAFKLTEGWRERKKEDALVLESSDLREFDKVVTVWGDDWLGYVILRSRHFQRILEGKNIGYQFKMELDFKKRFQGLANGKCDFVVATVDSYLVNGGDVSFPGVIVFVIDESFGGDAIIGKPGIESIDDLNKPEVRGAFVGFSPSEFLLKSQIAHFKLDKLLPRVPAFRVDDPAVALQKLADGAVDFAVLWEPLTSAALREVTGSKRLIDTSQARKIIVDVAIASRSLVKDDPDLVRAVSDAYFETLHYYFANSDEFRRLAANDNRKGEAEAGKMLAGIEFTGLQDNLNLAGLGDASAGSLHDRISNIASILVDVGDLSRDPFNGNARAITNSRFLNAGLIKGSGKNPKSRLATQRYYRPLSEADWSALANNITGTLIEKPITFGVGQSSISDEFQEDLRAAAGKLDHYPEHRVIVQAHVSAGSDPQIDNELSQQRADAIKDFLIREGKVAGDRIRAHGVGSSDPVAKEPGESDRAWKRRCRRAKIFIAPEA